MKYLWISLFFCLSLMRSVWADPPLPTPVGRVIWVNGSLTALMQNKEERKLQKQSVIYQKDTLITDDKSQAQIAFTDDSLMTFQKNTRFSIEDYRLNKKNPSAGKYVMNLLEGGFRTVTGLIAKKNPDQYQVNSPVATIGVRGTDFAVQIDKGEIFMEQYTGKPCLKNTKGSICLDDKNKFAKANLNQMPAYLPTRPEVFKEKLKIESVKIAPFDQGGSSGGGKGGNNAGRGGSSNSFCISQ